MRVKNFVLGIGIVVVYALVLWQGLATFYPQPEWNDFCDSGIRGPRVNPIEADCGFDSELENKRNACEREKGLFIYEYDEDGCTIGGECDECSINYEDARDEYSRNVFIVSLIVGVLTFVLGIAILRIEPVGSALVGSGIWAVFYGTVSNWRNFGAGIRFGLLLLVLILLIWIAIRLNKKKERGFWFKLGFGR